MNLILVIFGALTFLFLFWRRLKEDYLSSQIFSTSFFVLLAILIVSLVSVYFLPIYWFWLDMVAVGLALTLGILKFHLRIFETLEASILGLLPWLGLIFLNDFIKRGSFFSFAGSLIIAAIIVLFYFLDTHYKGFTWYKSGRVGFSGLTVAGFFFLIRAAVAIFFPDVLSFVGGKEVFLSSILAFTSFLAVFNLAKENK